MDIFKNGSNIRGEREKMIVIAFFIFIWKFIVTADMMIIIAIFWIAIIARIKCFQTMN